MNAAQHFAAAESLLTAAERSGILDTARALLLSRASAHAQLAQAAAIAEATYSGNMNWSQRAPLIKDWKAVEVLPAKEVDES